MIEKIYSDIDQFKGLTLEDALALADACEDTEVFERLLSCAEAVRLHFHGKGIDLCSIVNARSGKCSENCLFCAQSAHHNTQIETYDLVDEDIALAMAKGNDAHGVERFSLVTAGRRVTPEFLCRTAPIYNRISQETDLKLCASMGFLTEKTAAQLVAMGVSRYHCNVETSRSFFPQICTTHNWEQKAETIHIARAAGMDVCSGGIIGLGETRRQRLEMACELRDLHILSIPINILNPIAGTPLADVECLSEFEILLSVALFRLINPRAIIRSAGGRNLLGPRQSRLYQVGANGAIVGDYLTTAGEGLRQDIAMFKELGFSCPSKGVL